MSYLRKGRLLQVFYKGFGVSPKCSLIQKNSLGSTGYIFRVLVMLQIPLSSLFPEHPSWLKPCHVGMSFINFWSGTQLVRNGWVLVCRMLSLSCSLLMWCCTFSKPFIFRRHCKYQPPESLQGSAMQAVSRHQGCRFPFLGWWKCRQTDHTSYLKKPQTMVWVVSHLPQDSLSSVPATSSSPLVSSGSCVAALIGTGKALTCSPWAGVVWT